MPPEVLGFVQLCLLQSGVDRVDPTSGQVERVLGLLLLAYALAGLVAALVQGGGTVVPGTVRVGLFLRGGAVVSGLLLVVLVLTGARLNPLADLQFVASLLLLALVAAPPPYLRGDRFGALLARWAVPVGLLGLVVSVPVTVVKLLALP